MAIDMIDDYAETQARMQMALDVATLSAGADLSHFASNSGTDLATWQADARAYYDANMPNTNFKATVAGSPATEHTIKLSASVTVPLYALIILGTNFSNNFGDGSSDSNSPSTQTVSASNSALRVPKSTLELALILDNTGSMADAAQSGGSTSKMEGLKTATNSLITNIFSVSGNDSYIGLVPFTTMVNLGTSIKTTGWLAQRFQLQFQQRHDDGQLGGCAVEPHTGDDIEPKDYDLSLSPNFTLFYYNVPSSGFTVATVSDKTNCMVQKSTLVTGLPLTYQSNASTSLCVGTATQPASFVGQLSTKSISTVTWDQNGTSDNRPCSI